MKDRWSSVLRAIPQFPNKGIIVKILNIQTIVLHSIEYC